MTNKTIENPSASVSKAAPVDSDFNWDRELRNLTDTYFIDDLRNGNDFYYTWYLKAGRRDSHPQYRHALSYVLGVLGANKDDKKYGEFADALKGEDESVIRAVFEFAQDLNDSLKDSMENNSEWAKKEYVKRLNQLNYYTKKVLEPAYNTLSDKQPPAEQPPAEQPPVEQPVERPPVEQPPVGGSDGESPEERKERLYRTALGLGVPQQVMTDALYDLSDFEQDMLYDVVDALNDVYSASIGYGNAQSSNNAEKRMHFDDVKQQEQEGLLKARKALDECYELGGDSAKRLLYVVRRMHKTLSESPDNKVRTLVAKSLEKVLDDMSVRFRYNESEAKYNSYLSEIPKVPEDWKLNSDEKLKDLENLNDDLLYILSRDGMREGIGKYFPPNVVDPLRFLVEHYMPPMSNDQTTFENWKNNAPFLRMLAEQLPWGGVDTEHTVNMLAPLLQDAQRYFTDTHPATPYGQFMSRLVREPERTQKMMARNDFRFERYEYIKRLREACGIRSKKQRARMMNGVLSDMNSDIASIRNLGSSANDPLPRDLKGDMEFLRNGAMKFKTDLEQLRDAVTDSMNGGTAEPPDWTGFDDWEGLLNPNNPLEGRAVSGATGMKAWEENESLHTMRKYIPRFEARDMWNDPNGDPKRIMRELRGRGIIPGGRPEYTTRPVINPKDFEELNAMVGPFISRDTRDMSPEEREATVHAFSQKALYIASNLAFGPNDGAAEAQFRAALEMASRCREGAATGTSRSGLSYNTQYGMFSRALRN